MRYNLRRGIHRGESSPRPAGWGTQPLRIQPSVCSRSNFRASRFTCRPAGALGYLVYAACYKPVAPLGLNAAQFAARYPSWGEFTSPSGLGNPTPTDSTFVCSRSNFRASRFTCRPSGAKCTHVSSHVSRFVDILHLPCVERSELAILTLGTQRYTDAIFATGIDPHCNALLPVDEHFDHALVDEHA